MEGAGETGADVRMMTSNLLPLLEDEVRRVGTAGQRIDAVVLLTGLNDIKECFLFAHSRARTTTGLSAGRSRNCSARSVTRQAAPAPCLSRALRWMPFHASTSSGHSPLS